MTAPAPDPVRPLRRPEPNFATLALATKRIPPGSWWNLRWDDHANRKNLFYASTTARLTPEGGKVSCLYLSPSERTSFLELFGDRLHQAREAKRAPKMEPNEFTKKVFLQVQTPELYLADLTHGKAIDDIHLDLGTLYAPDPKFPRAFAQAIFDHPAGVDGILYESRHTREVCAVIWCARTAALADIPFAPAGNLADRAASAGSHATLFGENVQVLS